MPGTITTGRRDLVAVLTLSNPAKRNALDPAMCQSLAAEIAAFAKSDVRAAVLTGDAAGKAFCAGFDLEALPSAGETPTAADDVFEHLMDTISRSPVPLIAALGGSAMGGGCELAAACDLRVAHAGVKLGLPPARLGIVYAPRGLVRLAALVGESRARRLFLTARTLDAQAAERIGLVDELVAEADVLPTALTLAAEIAQLAPLAVQGMRVTFEALLRRRAALDGAEGQAENERRAAAWRSEDAAEGRRAVAERRPPVFRGR